MATDNEVPIIHKMMLILEHLEREREGVTLARLGRDLEVPKTTIYRILKTLGSYQMVLTDRHGRYQLGPRLASLASAVAGFDLISVSRQTMEELSGELHETCKLTFALRDEAVVAAVVHSPTGFGIFTQVGRRFPLHAGAASKVLLAQRSDLEIAKLLESGLPSYTEKTITNPVLLRRQIDEIRARGWAEDNEEYLEGIMAVAAPIFDASGRVQAAMSVTFLAIKRERKDAIRARVVQAAASISRVLGAGAPARVEEPLPGRQAS
jgi:DNA-binding IclR family transcriptional regulator